jgi:hypothetical protein
LEQIGRAASPNWNSLRLSLTEASPQNRARIRAGQLLLAPRERIEAGEAGDIQWWTWYRRNIARSRRDGNKVMKLARAADPEAAAEAECAKNREAKSRERQRAGSDVSPDDDDDPDDPVEQALELVEDMSTKQRQRFFAVQEPICVFALRRSKR